MRLSAIIFCRCLGVVLMLASGVVAVGWGGVPVVITSGNAFISVGSDEFVHHVYVGFPLGIIAATGVFVGLAFVAMSIRRKPIT